MRGLQRESKRERVRLEFTGRMNCWLVFGDRFIMGFKIHIYNFSVWIKILIGDKKGYVSLIRNNIFFRVRYKI